MPSVDCTIENTAIKFVIGCVPPVNFMVKHISENTRLLAIPSQCYYKTFFKMDTEENSNITFYNPLKTLHKF